MLQYVLGINGTWGPFYMRFMSSWLKSYQTHFYCNYESNDQIMSQFCTCHDSSAVVACAKIVTWSDHYLSSNNTMNCKRFGLWNVKWAPGSISYAVSKHAIKGSVNERRRCLHEWGVVLHWLRPCQEIQRNRHRACIISSTGYLNHYVA